MASPSKDKFFSVTSPGFLYSAIVAVLTIIAAGGVQLPADPATVGSDFVTSLSTGGIFSLVGVIVSSLVFPIYNFVKSGLKFSFGAIFSLNTTWIALGNAAAAGIALTGFVLPQGTVEQIVGAVGTKDWMGLISILALTVGNTLIRFIKERQRLSQTPA